jgi:capsule polysaccharide export protein KpsE/RkpR
MSHGERAELKRILEHMLVLEALVLRMEKRIMSDVQNLTAAVQRLNNSVKAELDAIKAKLSGDNPDIAAAVTQLGTLSDQLDAETAALTAGGANVA